MGKCMSTTEESITNDTESNQPLVNTNGTNAMEEQKYDINDIKTKPKHTEFPKNAPNINIRTSISKSKSVSHISLVRPLTADSTIDTSFISINNTRSKRDIYQLRLEGINICKPWYLALNDNCTMNQVETIINYHLGLDMNTIQYNGKHETN
eukprot:496504_1